MTSQGTRISWPLRAWLVVEIFFGVASVMAVGLAPAETETNFAWPIKSVVMAAVLGAFYFSTALGFVLPLFAKRWEMIRVLILPIALFTTVQLAVTVIHWELFSVGTLPFYIWFASYLLPPPIFLGAYFWHQRKAGSTRAPSGDPLPGWLRGLALVLGGTLTLVAILVFVFPALLIPIFPWALTALTARTLAGWLAAFGTILLSLRRENSRAGTRLVAPALILLFPATLFQILRFADEVAWGNPLLWLILLVFAVVGYCGLVLARGSWRDVLR